MFSPAVDERCDMELDETDPAIWLKLEAAVEEYIQKNSHAFKDACERLLMPFQHDEKWSENLRSQHFPKSKASNEGIDSDIFLQSISMHFRFCTHFTRT